MDWMYYLIIFAVIFSLLAVLKTVHYLLNRRLEIHEKKRRIKEETQQISESNSGL